jgi:hypothetical protein
MHGDQSYWLCSYDFGPGVMILRSHRLCSDIELARQRGSLIINHASTHVLIHNFTFVNFLALLLLCGISTIFVCLHDHSIRYVRESKLILPGFSAKFQPPVSTTVVLGSEVGTPIVPQGLIPITRMATGRS